MYMHIHTHICTFLLYTLSIFKTFPFYEFSVMLFWLAYFYFYTHIYMDIFINKYAHMPVLTFLSHNCTRIKFALINIYMYVQTYMQTVRAVHTGYITVVQLTVVLNSSSCYLYWSFFIFYIWSVSLFLHLLICLSNAPGKT